MHRVLIVDDSELFLAQLTEELGSLGYEVAGVARSGAEAVEAARRLTPDIVLMDILMPGDPDGIDAARAVRDQLDIPVIFLSASEDDAVIKRACAARAYGFLSKPAGGAELKASIELALVNQSTQAGINETIRDVVEYTNDLIYVVDGQGTIKYVNQQILGFSGYTKGDVLANSFASYLTPGSVTKAVEVFKRQVRGEDVGPFELEFMDHSGAVRVVEIRERAVWKDGRIVEVHGIGRDVTDRKRAEADLTAAREQYRLLAENAAEGIAVVQDGVIKYANPALHTMAGCPKGGLAGLPFIGFIHPDDREIVFETHTRVLAGDDDPAPVTRRYLDCGGSVHIVENASMPCTWEGRPAAIVLINDVTQARLAEQLLTTQRDIGVFLGTADELDGAMSVVLYRLLEIPGLDCGGIYLVEEPGGPLRMAAHRGLSTEFVSQVEFFDAGSPEAGEVSAGGTILFSAAEIEADPNFEYLRAEGITHLVVVPVLFEGAVVALVNVATHEKEAVSARVVAAVEDIAARLGSAISRLRDRELLAESEKKYRTLIENAKEGIVVVQDGRIKYINPTGVRISGYPPEELVGRPFGDLIYPEDLEGVAARYAREMAGETLREPNAYRVIWKDGTVRWTEGIGVPIEWEGRRASLSFIEDITEQKLVKDALVESEQKFRGVFETSRDFMYIAALDGTILDYNRSAREFFGYTEEEIAQLNLKDIYAYPEEREQFVQKVIRDGFVENYEIKLKKKDGSLIDTLVTVVPKKDAQGEVIGLQGSVKDVTQMRRLERRLVQTEKLTSLGTMVSGIAHELNNPLTAIMGNAEMLTTFTELPEEVVRRLETIAKESLRTSKIIKGLLSFAREHKPERRLISVNESIMESYKLREYNLKVSDIRVELLLSRELSPTYGDPYQLQQVFVNIINNATDALAERKGATLTIRSRQQRGWLVVEFEDNGHGIEPENLKRIFDPFFTTKEVGKGTGLGLSMAYGIVNEHGGTIEAVNVPAGGTIFTVSIPVTGAPASDGRTAEVPRIGVHAGKHILVVEDEAHLRDLFLDVLAERGYNVLAASGADEAIGLIKERDFDAIITDIKMPGPGGIGLYRYITDQHPGLTGRIIFITGDILGVETRSFLSTTDCAYLEKPFTVNDLLNVLTTVLAR